MPEQQVLPEQVWTAPISMPSSDTAEGALDLIYLCSEPDDRYPKLLETCEEILITIVRSLGERTLAETAALTHAQAEAVEFQQRGRAHLMTALEQQADRGTFLFWLAVILVGLGIIAAALQFLKSWRSPAETNIELAISEKQLSVKTSWIGVVLLGLSMGFLVIYLIFVYEITPLG